MSKTVHMHIVDNKKNDININGDRWDASPKNNCANATPASKPWLTVPNDAKILWTLAAIGCKLLMLTEQGGLLLWLNKSCSVFTKRFSTKSWIQ